MNYKDVTGPAAVQYDEWVGTIAADSVDMYRIEELIGADPEYWVLMVDMTIYGGNQTLVGLGVPTGTTSDDLTSMVERGEQILLKEVCRIEWDLESHMDTNPPAPMTTPVVSATEFLGYGFKRLHVRLVCADIPDGAQLVSDADI